MIQLFNKDYCGESLYDLDRDIHETFDSDYNPVMVQIPIDEHGFQKGTFTVTVTWSNDE